MDLGITLIVAIIVTICVLPFLLMSKSKKNRQKKILQVLSNMAIKHSGKITQYEFCGDFVIGIDENTNAVFFFKKTNNIETKKYVNLAKTQKCQVINTSKIIKTKNSSYKEIDKLGLSLLPSSKYKPVVTLEFYNYDDSLPLRGELQLLEKWFKLINSRLKPENSEGTREIVKEKVYTAQVM